MSKWLITILNDLFDIYGWGQAMENIRLFCYMYMYPFFLCGGDVLSVIIQPYL
jgi:hypothetical protein